MRRSSRSAILICASLVVFGTSACAPSNQPDEPKKAATNATIPDFRYGLEAVPGTLDVANNYNSADMAVMGLVTQPLEIANLDGTYTPVLAEEVTQPDSVTLVYELRDDVTFSDGSPLTADDVVWTIEHLQGPTTQTTSELTDIKKVEATAPLEVTISLARPNNALRGSLDIISFIHSKNYGEKVGDKLGTPEAPPLGTGPYVVDNFASDRILLKRNAEYAGDAPAPDQVTFTGVSDDNSAQLAMRSGELDAYAVLDAKAVSTWKSISGVSLYSSPTLYLDYVTMDTSKPPFDDVHVRRAVAYATDVDGLLSANYGEEATLPQALTPTQIISRMAPDEASGTALNDPFGEYSFDLAKARDELAQSSHADGFTAEYEYYSPAGKIVGLSLAESLEEIGITLTLKSRRISDFIGDLFVGKAPEVSFFSIAAVVPDPASWYIYLVGKDNPYNASRYSTPETESALYTINMGGDESARWEAMKTITEAMATDVPYIGLSQPTYPFVVGPEVTFDNEPDFIEMTTGVWVNHIKAAG